MSSTTELEDKDWHALEIDTVFQIVGSSQNGLDDIECKRRLKEHGLNVLETKSSETIPYILWRQLQNPIVYVLLLSTLLAFALRKYTDGIVVFSVVILNTSIGFVQEYRANRIIRALSAMTPHKTTVIRDGDQKLIPASHVVPGDIVILQAGDKIPADMRLFSIKSLQCDESALTGESLPISKRINSTTPKAPIAERKCMAYSGTFVTAGTGLGVVIATGVKTEFGKISELIERITPLETPLSLTLKRVAGTISYGVLVIGVLLFIIGYLRGGTLFDAGLTAITLAVAAIPEGFPAIVTIASAIGVRRMARRKAIIRQLPAVEALGSTTVICTDKTGTLTHNEMTVQRLWTDSGFSFVTGVGFSIEGRIISPEGKKPLDQIMQEEIIPLFRAAVLCNDASIDPSQSGESHVGDPTEIALVVAGRKAHLNENQLRAEWQREDILPFEPEKRMMATLNTAPSKKQYTFIKGAPEQVLLCCPADEPSKVKLLERVNEMATEGMRVLAVAEKVHPKKIQAIDDKELKSGFRLLGLIGMVDPPRKEVYQAIQACHQAGIIVKMVTGDHPITATSIGKDLGILDKNSAAISGSELSQLNPEEWKEIALHHLVFARVSPEHKLKLIEALQECGHVVAMTGDGVNDSPALKRADIGISMGIKGTAVAKEASDMVLADDNFASIEAAVEEGRRVYDNLIKALVFILPTSLGQALVILIAVLLFPFRDGALLHPMLPVQILWINLVVAVALSLPLAFEIQEPDIMNRPPRKKNAPILSRFILIRTLTVSVFMAIGAIALFIWKYQLDISTGKVEVIAISEARTMAVTAMMLFQVFYLFHCRLLKPSITKMNFFSNPSILIGVAFVLIAQIAFIYFPFMNRLFYSSSLDMESWIISIGVSLMIFLLIALEKAINQTITKWRNIR
ncbi:MAG: HAD-IC family P-type ATPase [Verrucomicrobia bacterium]|nr:HAD-IC family P-type ATPase [Verrucomicrobiota bacterium]